MNPINIPVNSSYVALDGIHHYQEAILSNLTNTAGLKDACQGLSRFIGKHQDAFNQATLSDCQERLKQIDVTDTPSEQQIKKLFKKLYQLEANVARTPYTARRQPLNPASHQALDKVSQQMGTIETIRKNLAELKELTQLTVQQGLLTAETAAKYGQFFEQRFNAILQNLLLHGVHKLEQRGMKGPDLTMWSALVLGSLARGEGHPYSDIDLVFLIDPSLEGNQEARKYFEALMQEVADLVHQVGEEGEGFKLCGGNLTPPYLTYPFRFADKTNSSDLLAGGMGSFLATPHRMAILTYQSAISYVPMKGAGSMILEPVTGNENLIAPCLLDAKPILGNETLYNQFYELRKKLGTVKASDLFDASRYEDLPWKESNTAEDLLYKSILGKTVHNRGPADFERAKVNIKKDFMRPIQMGVSTLAAKFDIKERSTAGRIEALAKIGFFSREDADLIKKTYLTLYKMRIEESAIFGGENDDVALSEEGLVEASEKQKLLFREFCKLSEEEFSLYLSKKEGKESMTDLIKNRQLQEAYQEEIRNLGKFASQQRVLAREVFDVHKAVCIKTIEVINKYKDAL